MQPATLGARILVGGAVLRGEALAPHLWTDLGDGRATSRSVPSVDRSAEAIEELPVRPALLPPDAVACEVDVDVAMVRRPMALEIV